MNALYKFRFCFLAGLCAAGCSFFGKLPSLLKKEFPYKTDTTLLNQTQIYAEFILYQCLPIALMIVSNLLNWRYFLKALQMCEQTLTATVLTAASNYVVTVLLFIKNPFPCYQRLAALLLFWAYGFYVLRIPAIQKSQRQIELWEPIQMCIL